MILRFPGVGASRNVDGDEESKLCPHITVLLALQVDVRSYDLADVVDAISESLRRPGHIDPGERAVLVQKSVIDAGVIEEVSHHVTLIVDSKHSRDCSTGKVNRLKHPLPQ